MRWSFKIEISYFVMLDLMTICVTCLFGFIIFTMGVSAGHSEAAAGRRTGKIYPGSPDGATPPVCTHNESCQNATRENANSRKLIAQLRANTKELGRQLRIQQDYVRLLKLPTIDEVDEGQIDSDEPAFKRFQASSPAN